MADRKDKKAKPRGASEVPQPVKIRQPEGVSFDPSPLLARIDKLENGQRLLSNAVDFVKSTNWFVLAVLFLGFIALLASFISGVIQVTNSNTVSQIEFVKTMEQLTHDVNDLKLLIKLPKSTDSGNVK